MGSKQHLLRGIFHRIVPEIFHLCNIFGTAPVDRHFLRGVLPVDDQHTAALFQFLVPKTGKLLFKEIKRSAVETGFSRHDSAGKIKTFFIEEIHLVRQVYGPTGNNIKRKKHFLLFINRGAKAELIPRIEIISGLEK